ncbi:MAG: hypothetical protein RLZ55_761 [Actinomycetota bacterium]
MERVTSPSTPRMHVPPGHHYSPLPSGADIARAPATGGPGPREIPGVDLHDEAQWRLLHQLLPLYPATSTWLTAGAGGHFTLDNTWFTGSDAVLYALMLQHVRPRRVVEVGAGYTSALAYDVVQRFWSPKSGVEVDLTFIDPAAERVRELLPPDVLAGRLREQQVQDTPNDVFDALSSGDILMIDSSHVLKAGSDVHHLLLQVVPGLAPGVWVHLHDVFHPFEYPAGWLADGTALNEAYAVRALLQGNSSLRVMLWNHYLQRFAPGWFAEHMPLCLSAPFATGGIWLRTEGVA